MSADRVYAYREHLCYFLCWGSLDLSDGVLVFLWRIIFLHYSVGPFRLSAVGRIDYKVFWMVCRIPRAIQAHGQP